MQEMVSVLYVVRRVVVMWTSDRYLYAYNILHCVKFSFTRVVLGVEALCVIPGEPSYLFLQSFFFSRQCRIHLSCR